MEDHKIIELFLGRNETAIHESNLKYGRYCHSIAYHILNNLEDSEECVNDTWMNAWNAIPPTIPKILKAYFGKISRNLALNKYALMTAEKRGGTECAIALEELGECIADPVGTNFEDRELLTGILNEFLKTLDQQKRVIFVKRYWYIEPVKKIAEDLGISESKVKMTLLRTRNKLAEVLKKEGIAV